MFIDKRISVSLLAIILFAFFMTESAFAKESDIELPIGSVGGSVRADLFTGSATTSIPIIVPPGRQGIQPQLDLVYGSSNGNGWIGMGWKLEKSVIDRQTKNGVNYTADDYRFSLSGINADLVSTGENNFQTKIESSFIRVRKLVATDGKPYFEATDKTGKKHLFGQTTATRVSDPTDSSKIFRWCLDRVEDIHGNYMTISYSGSQGYAYLLRIDYTGNVGASLATTNSVIFHLENHSRPITSWKTGFPMTLDKRLKTIQILANDNLIRAYKLDYTLNPINQTSLLHHVQQFGNDAVIDSATGEITGGSSLPPITLGYQNGKYRMNGKFSNKINRNEIRGGPKRIIADFNGDAISDIVYYYPRWGTTKLFLNTRKGGKYKKHENFISRSKVKGGYFTFQSGDFNGDGKDDLFFWKQDSGKNWLLISNGNGTFIEYENPINEQIIDRHNMRLVIGDYNNDGKSDVYFWRHTDGKNWMFYSNGNGAFTRYQNPIPKNSIKDKDFFSIIGDFNGDKKSDIYFWRARDGKNKLYLSNGNGGFTETNSPIRSAEIRGNYLQLDHGDFNGDGLTDLFFWNKRNGSNDHFYSKGNGAFLQYSNQVPMSFSNPRRPTMQVGDFNGDGMSDLFFWSRWSGVNALYYSRGNQSRFKRENTPIRRKDIDDKSKNNSIGDFNGDGLADIEFFWLKDGNNYVYYNKTWHPELLHSIENGYGGKTIISYESSTSYVNTRLPYVVQTVKEICIQDGTTASVSSNTVSPEFIGGIIGIIGIIAEGNATQTNNSCADQRRASNEPVPNKSVTQYEFSGGYYHMAEKEFRGFNSAKITSPAGPNSEQTITEVWFHQGDDIAIDVNDPSALKGYMVGAEYRKHISDGSGNLYTRTTTTYTEDADGIAPFYTPPAQMNAEICDGNACSIQTQINLTYDIYGNVIEEKYHGDLSVTTDDRTTTRTYSPNITEWIVGLPATETIHEGIGTSGPRRTHTDFYYDGSTSCNTASTNQIPIKGLLTRSVKWLNLGTNPETRIAYDNSGNPICSRNANGAITTKRYDPQKTFEISFTDTLNHTTTTQYYGVNSVPADNGLYGQIKNATDPNGSIVSTAYDVLGRKLTTTGAANGVTTISYNNLGVVGSQHIKTDSPLGLSRWSYFDGLGRTIKTKTTGTDSKIIVTEKKYGLRGKVLSGSLPYFEVGGKPLWATISYDPMGRTLETKLPDETKLLSCYDDNISVNIDANGHKTRVVKDAKGFPLISQTYMGKFSRCDTSEGFPYATITHQYDIMGNLRFTFDSHNNRTQFFYDSLSRKILTEDPDKGIWRYRYDSLDNLIGQVDAKGQHIWFQYDLLNRQIQKDFGTQKNLGSGDVMYIYGGTTSNGIGRLTNVQDSTGTSAVYYDIKGRVIQTDKIIDSVTYSTHATFDTLDRILTTTYPDGSVITKTYNGPQLATVAKGATVYATYTGYDALGKHARVTYGNGVKTDYVYHEKNFRLSSLQTKKDSTVLQNLSYTFDNAGNITTLADTVKGDQTYVYDDLDRLISGTIGQNTFTYAYNRIGNMTQNSRVGDYDYGASQAANQPVQPEPEPQPIPEPIIPILLDDNFDDGDYDGWTVDETFGRRDWRVRRGSLHQTDDEGERGNQRYSHVGPQIWYTNGIEWTDYSVSFDFIPQSDHGTFGVVFRYVDSQNYYRFSWRSSQMFIVKKQNGVFSLLASLGGQSRIVDGRTYNIKVAANGNQLSVEIGGTEILTVQDDTFPNGSIGFNTYRLETAFDNVIVRNLTPPSPPPAPVPPVIFPPLMDSTNQPHAVKTAGSNTYTYDANGNMATVGNRSFTFNHENRLSKITDGGVITDFTYDGDGARVKKLVNNVDTTIYISSGYVCERGSCEMYIMAHGQKIVSIDSNGVVNYIHQNHLNSTSVMTDSSGASIKSLVYYPYGATLSSTGSANPRYEYTGKEKDNSTGLYFYETRYYDSTLGRFISPDNVIPDALNPDAFNRYSYALNNPILYSDPSGEWAFLPFLIGAVISGSVTAAMGGDIGDIFLSAFIGGISAGVGGHVYGVAIAAGFAPITAGIAAGVTGALVSSIAYQVAGYDVNIGRSVGIAILTAGITGGLNIQAMPWEQAIVVSGLIGGGMSELTGGDFATGFAIAAASSAVYKFAQYVQSMETQYSEKSGTGSKPYCKPQQCIDDAVDIMTKGSGTKGLNSEYKSAFQSWRRKGVDVKINSAFKMSPNDSTKYLGGMWQPSRGPNGTATIFTWGLKSYADLTHRIFHEFGHVAGFYHDTAAQMEAYKLRNKRQVDIFNRN